ncbi:molybdenum cofactor guanylyltransferase [Halovenus halobia]|uniref:molybdenum cofactor guanylyltransferase n=1 Tax=Halovenus halobia TaxID=3396622 RepID=UPI003F549BCB
MRSGVIIAGGYSTRFGEADKAVAELAGRPMIRRVADRLEPVVDELIVNCRPAQTERIRAAMDGYPLAVEYGLDEQSDLGPVAGIRNGLQPAAGEYAAVVACDMPFVESALVEYLFERAEAADAAVSRLDSGYYEPTQAVYRVESMIDACERALDTEGPRIVDAIDELAEVVVVDQSAIESVASTESFENVNTPEELAAATDRLQ